MEAAVDVHDLAADRARVVRQQEADRVGDRRRILDVPPERRLRAATDRPGRRSPGSRAPRPCRGARRTRGSPGSRAGRGRAPGTARPTRARPWRRPSSRRSATRRSRRSRARRCSTRSPSAARAPPPATSARTRWSGTRPPRSPAGVVRNLPPSASSGANAIACSAPSTLPQRSRNDEVIASRSAGLFTSSSSTSTSCESRLAARSVIRRARPKLVSTHRGALVQRSRSRMERDRVFGDHACDQELLALEDHDGVTGARLAGAGQRPQRAGQPLARVGRLDQLVDESGRGGRLGPQVLVGVLIGQTRRARPRRRRRHGARAG